MAGALLILYRTQDDDDPFIKGEFDVIKELLEKIPEAKDGKQKVTYRQFSVKMMSQNSVSGFLLEKLPEAKDGKQKVTCSGIQGSRSTF